MYISDIKELIDRLKEQPITPDNIKELADLYVIYDHLRSETE